MSETHEPPSDAAQEQAVSLDELAQAYAESLGTSVEPPSEPGQAAPPLSQPAEAREDDLSEAPADRPPLSHDEDPDQDDPCPVAPATIFEAMLFVGSQSNEPLTAAQAAELMRGVSPGEIPALVDGLNRRYASSGCPYRITSEGAGYRITLHKRFHPIRNKFYGRVREARLSQAALDVLAIVAYRQPITCDDVTRLRDHPSGQILSQLVRRQLLRIERPPGKRRPVTYHTTNRFLELFGLANLDDLPQAEDLENR